MKIVFTYLTAFSQNGGIEKFNKTFIYALQKTFGEKSLKLLSVYDSYTDKKYTADSRFSGFGGKRLKYLQNIWKTIFNADMLIVGHINLAIVGIIAKKLKPKLKLVFITHGIEVWEELGWKKKALQYSDLVLCVSRFTANKIHKLHNVPYSKINIFPNTFDPFFSFPTTFDKPQNLLERYGIQPHQKIILTICRLSAKEAYKGYDRIIESLPTVLETFNDAVYLITGKYDAKEKERLDKIIEHKKLQNHIAFTGFVPDSELTAHFLLGDVFAMPSKNEGFGIVFIEAMSCGLPVVAGNMDGSTDAVANGELGSLVNPDSVDKIAKAIIDALKNEHNTALKKELQQKVIEKFGIDNYLKNVRLIAKKDVTI